MVADYQMSIFRKDLLVDTKAIDVKKRRVPVVASTEAIDGHDEIVEQIWDFSRFGPNPVILWNHNKIFQPDTRPIGRGENYRVENEGTPQARLALDIIMASKEANEHAHSVLLLFAEGVQRAVSVGFRPRDIRREVRDDRDIVVLSDNLLLEVSATPIGSNPDALAEQRSAELEYIKQHLDGVVVIGRAVVPYQGYPVITGTWDSKAAEKRVRAWAGGEDSINWGKYRRAFTWYDSANPEVFDSYKLPHHDVMDGELRTHRGGVIAAGNAIQGARGGVNIPDSDKAGVRSHLGRHYKQFDMQPPWERSEPYDLQKDSPSPVRGDDNNQGADMSDKTLEETKAALKAADAEVARLKTENSAYKSQNEQLVNERDEAKARAENAEKEISDAKKAKEEAEIEAEVDKEVGVRITPAEKDNFLELRRTNPKLYKSMLEQRQPMTHTERSAGNDTDPDAGNSHRSTSDGSDASDALDAEAGC